jgi:hypothetical protein
LVTVSGEWRDGFEEAGKCGKAIPVLDLVLYIYMYVCIYIYSCIYIYIYIYELKNLLDEKGIQYNYLDMMEMPNKLSPKVFLLKVKI